MLVLVLVALSLMQSCSRITIGGVMGDYDLGGPKSQSDVDDFPTFWSFAKSGPEQAATIDQSHKSAFDP
ncbi:hypothetical protein [Pseudomonas sp.]|uniref:hypothetical protein n=1 Tax=Pseudomonas sp. TaxID=306 RepID=UPI0028B0EAB0|nr:hypothetical protein [Pseudomonas sp.]